MLSSIARTAQAYGSLYKGKTLLVKVSGAEIASADLPILADDIRWLVARGINIILVYGGGEQISAHYGRERQKIDGVGVTDASVMEEGVLPAYEEIRGKLLSLMPEGVCMEPSQLQCTRHPDTQFGLVGMPASAEIPETSLVFLGFVGQDETGALLNVNADDIARIVVEEGRREIEELFFFTKTGGVLTDTGEVATLLSGERIDTIVKGKDPSVKVDGGMKKKLLEVKSILPKVGKVVMTTIKSEQQEDGQEKEGGGLRREIEQWKGSGTLCLDLKQAVIAEMTPEEEIIFDRVYAEFVVLGFFKKRSQKEIDTLKDHHRILRVKSSPLGGYSLVPKNGWVELSTLWSAIIGNGIGKMLIQKAYEEANGAPLYALSTNGDAIRTFNASGLFENLGPLSDALKTCPEKLPEHLKAYDTSERDPHVFIAKPKDAN